MFLDVNLVEHHILLLGVDVCFHLHGNMTGKDRQQETLLQREANECVIIASTSLLTPLHTHAPACRTQEDLLGSP